jgi:predicted DNA-binding transcriptional regulator AlpA
MPDKHTNKTDLRKYQLLHAKQLMELLNIGKTSFYEMKATGRLPKPVRIGTIQRWRLADVEKWLQLGCPSLEKFEKMKGGC